MQSSGNSKRDLQPAATTAPENLSEIHYFQIYRVRKGDPAICVLTSLSDNSDLGLATTWVDFTFIHLFEVHDEARETRLQVNR